MTERNLVNKHTFVRQGLCAGKADGLSLGISEFGAHPAISAAGLFGHHMRLLGLHPANWTPNPIGCPGSRAASRRSDERVSP
jgi:hypothetical protein